MGMHSINKQEEKDIKASLQARIDILEDSDRFDYNKRKDVAEIKRLEKLIERFKIKVIDFYNVKPKKK